MVTTLDMLNQIAPQKGVSDAVRNYLVKVMGAESGGKADARSSTSSAHGLFQITDSTWATQVRKHPGELTMSGRNDPRQQMIAGIYLTNDNAAALQRAGHEVNDGNLYLAHFLGAGGANKILSADPSAKLADIMPGIIGPNKGIRLEYTDRNGQQRQKSFADFTVGDVRAWTTKKMGGRIRYDLLDSEVQSSVDRWDGDEENPRNNFRAVGDMTFVDLVMEFLGAIIQSAFSKATATTTATASPTVAPADQTTVVAPRLPALAAAPAPAPGRSAAPVARA